jgi:hypothetical protein
MMHGLMPRVQPPPRRMTMSETSMWIIPEAPPPSAGGTLQQERKSEPAGLRLGILDNAKSNADHLLALIIESVRASLPVASVVRLRKPSSAAGAEQEILDELAEKADCVITAMAD